MKFFKLNIFNLTVFYLITSSFSMKLKLNQKKKDNFFNDDPKMADSNRIPMTINIHMEDYDSDPINFRRFDGERKTYSMRVNELHERYENEKKALVKVITLQQSKIEHLSEMADSINRILEPMTIKPAKTEYRSMS